MGSELLRGVRAVPSTKARDVVQGPKQKSWCRRWDSNPHGRLCPTVFETVASTIPPLRQVRVRVTKTSVFDGLAVCAWRACHHQKSAPCADRACREDCQRSVANDDHDGRRYVATDLSRRTQAARTSNLSTKLMTVGRSASSSKSSMKS